MREIGTRAQVLSLAAWAQKLDLFGRRMNIFSLEQTSASLDAF